MYVPSEHVHAPPCTLARHKAIAVIPVLDQPVVLILIHPIAHHQHSVVQVGLGAEVIMVDTAVVELGWGGGGGGGGEREAGGREGGREGRGLVCLTLLA